MSEKKTVQKKIKYPTKKTLNLMIKEKTLASPTRLIPILLLIVVGALAFSKFAVVDRLAKVDKAESELATMKNQLELIQNAFSDYDQVEDQYSRYSYENFDRTIPDRIDVLEMLEIWFMPVCRIQSLSMNGRDLSMTIADINMDTITYLNGVLTHEEPMVESIKITSYVDNTDRDQSGERTVTATVNIYLADATNTYNPDALEFDPDAIINEGMQSEEPEQTVDEPVDEPVGDGTEADNNTVEPENTDSPVDDANIDSAENTDGAEVPVDGTENGGEE